MAIVLATVGYLYHDINNPTGKWVVSSAGAGVEYYYYNIPLPLTTEKELEPLDEGSDMSGGREADVAMHQFMVGEEDYILELFNDGTYTLTVFGGTEYGTWSKLSKSVLVFYKPDGSEFPTSFEEGYITFEDQSTQYTLRKRYS